MMKNNIN